MTGTSPSIDDLEAQALHEAAALVAEKPLSECRGATAAALERAWSAGLEAGDRFTAAGRGIGAALLAACEAWAFERAEDLFLLVKDDNAAARRFYERRSFVVIGQIHDFVLPGIDETIMRKRRPSSTDRAPAATGTSQPPPHAPRR